jgi:hypothetical protein
MARIKFNELAKQTMTPEAIARSRKAAMKEIAAMELAGPMKVCVQSRNFKARKTRNGREPDQLRGLR